MRGRAAAAFLADDAATVGRSIARVRRQRGARSQLPEEPEVESSEHQDNENIHYQSFHYQSFPESASQEREIYTDNDGYHCHHAKHDSYLSSHFSRYRRRFRYRPLMTGARSARAGGGPTQCCAACERKNSRKRVANSYNNPWKTQSKRLTFNTIQSGVFFA